MAESVEFDTMYFGAHLTAQKKNVLIPDYWIANFNWEKSINEGLNRNENHLIFFSSDLAKDPDFSMPASKSSFDPTVDKCYFGKLVRAFSKFFVDWNKMDSDEKKRDKQNDDDYSTGSKGEAVKYLEKRRPIVPAVYSLEKSGGRQFKDTHLLSETEYNNAIGTNFNAMNNRFVVKTEKFCEEISGLRNRITAYNVSDIDDGLDDSDVEFIQDEIDDNDSDLEFEALMPKPAITIIKTESAENSAQNDNEIDAQNNHTDNHSGANEYNPEANAQTDVEPVDPDGLSDKIPFISSETKDRYYEAYDVSVRSGIVDCLTAWNTTRPFSTVIYDKNFIGVLLKEVFKDEIKQEKLNETKLDFMKLLFEIRVKNDQSRADRFDAIVMEKHEKAKNKRRAVDTLESDKQN